MKRLRPTIITGHTAFNIDTTQSTSTAVFSNLDCGIKLSRTRCKAPQWKSR
jgi:hypothetical protein